MKKLMIVMTALTGTLLWALASCSSNDSKPDAGTCGSIKELDCVVTVLCETAVSHTDVVICDRSNDATEIEAKARDAAMAEIGCTGTTGGYLTAATCTAPLDAITCPAGFELEDTTICIPKMTYDADTSGICAHLPATDDACGHACDRDALYTFSVPGKFTTQTCESTDGIQFVVGIAPDHGDGARCTNANAATCPLAP